MYNFQILCLRKPRIAHLEASTDLMNPLVYEGVTIEKKFGTDCIRINGVLHQVPVNEMNCVEVNGNLVSFGYFLPQEYCI